MLLIQCLALCGLFTLLILPPQFKDPLSQIVSYPPAIRQRVESLPRYQARLSAIKRGSIAKKAAGTLIATVALAALAWFSSKTSFVPAFVHVFTLFMSVNLYDLIVLDLILFRHSKKVVIPGTEDMTAQYKDPWHHVKGALKGTAIGIAAAALSAGLIHWARMML